MTEYNMNDTREIPIVSLDDDVHEDKRSNYEPKKQDKKRFRLIVIAGALIIAGFVASSFLKSPEPNVILPPNEKQTVTPTPKAETAPPATEDNQEPPTEESVDKMHEAGKKAGEIVLDAGEAAKSFWDGFDEATGVNDALKSAGESISEGVKDLKTKTEEKLEEQK